MPIPYGRQSVDESDIAAVVEVLRSPFLTQGPAVGAFEAAFAEACDAPHAVAFSSGTAALHGAAFAAGLGPGTDLLTSAITFSASANCGAYLGATPRFADIDPVTWNVTPESVAAAMTPATRTVIPVHFTGLPADVAGIRPVVGGGGHSAGGRRRRRHHRGRPPRAGLGARRRADRRVPPRRHGDLQHAS